MIIVFKESYLQQLFMEIKKAKEEYLELLEKAGVQQSNNKKIVVICIALNEYAGHTILFDLFEQCEKLYKRKVDQDTIRFVTYKTIEQARCSPLLMQSSFILTASEDILDAEIYPELEKILPWQ